MADAAPSILADRVAIVTGADMLVDGGIPRSDQAHRPRIAFTIARGSRLRQAPTSTA
jgi:hypothetical protein